MPISQDSEARNASNQRLDDAAVTHFLTSTAGALSACGLIAEKDIDSLRVALASSGSRDTGGRDSSLLVELEAQKADFLAFLVARWGVVGLCLNLTRHTLRGAVQETATEVARFGEQLLQKVPLLFNRPFYLYRGGVCQRQTLYSTVLVDFADTLARAWTQLGTVQSELGLFNPSAMAPASASGRDDEAVDLAVAKALGGSGLVAHTLLGYSEQECKRQTCQSLSLVADFATQLAEQLAANTNERLAHDVVAASEGLKAECQRLDLLELPRGDSLVIWEVRRQHLLSCLGELTSALREVAKTSLAAIVPSQTPPQRPPHALPLPAAVKRRLVFDLMASGTAPQPAAEAASALLRYLETNQLAPHQVLPAELNRIHPQLGPSALNTLVASASDASLMTASAGAKGVTLKRAEQLAAAFKAGSNQLVAGLALLICSLCLSGCGLKTLPQSNILEPRPDIPFRGEPPRKEVDELQQRKDTQRKAPLAAGVSPASATEGGFSSGGTTQQP